VKLEEMLKLFLDSRKHGITGARKKCADSTLEFYEDRMRVFLDYLIEHCDGIMKYESIRRLHIVQFLGWLDKQEWSDAYKQGVLRSVKAFFNWVDKDEDCRLYELKGMQRYLPAIGRTPQRTDIPRNFDIRQFRASFDLENKWQFRDYVASSLMINNGIRIAELCDIKLGDLFFDNNQVKVTGKGSKSRLVPLTNDMIRLLRAWIKRRESIKTAADSDYLFVSKYKGKMTGGAFAHKFQKHCVKHSLPRITPHSFRHAFCTNYLVKGGNMEKLRNISGHSSYDVLRTYLHVGEMGSQSLKDEVERVNLLKDV
jgi:integrase/recombinase XerD